MDYLKAYTIGSIFATSWRIYFREWLTLLTVYFIPLAIAHTFNASMTHLGVFGTALGAIFLLFASFFVSFPMTVAISEICLNIKPSVVRCYKRAFDQPSKLIGTYLLTIAIIAVGLLLLLVPGMIFSLWYAFIGPVVVLESLSGRSALRRSRELGKGHYLRNFGVLFLAQAMVLLASMLLGGIIGLLFAISGASDTLVLEFVAGWVGVLVAAPAVIITVLLYYDMRVRKEGYGATQLADDLR